MSIGTHVSPTTANPDLSKEPKVSVFDLTIGRSAADPTGKPAPRDGTYQGGLLAASNNGRDFLVDGTNGPLTVTLTHNRSAGSFSGTTRTFRSQKGQHVSGTFSC